MDLSLRLLADAANAQGAFKDFGSAVTAAGKVISDFAKESIKAFADAEKVQRQLRLAAGEYTKALNEQAEALKRKYAVDDDQIRQMDVLLLRYGAAPGQIKATTEAILDYAAATGKDATQAMEMLIRGVESGTGSLGKMGVHFKTTGKFTSDLASAVDALGKKFGGAGEEDAQSLAGRMRGVSLAVDDIKKLMGSWFDEMERRTHIIDKLAESLNKLVDVGQRKGAKGFFGRLVGTRGGFDSEEEFVRAGMLAGDENDPEWQKRIERARQIDEQARLLIGKLKASGAIPSDAGRVDNDGLPMTSAGDHSTDHSKTAQDSALQKFAEYNRKHTALLIQRYEEELKRQQEYNEKYLDAENALNDALFKITEAQDKEKAEFEKAEDEKHWARAKDMAAADDFARSQLAQKEGMWASTGMALGNAFADAMARAMEGGAQDGEEIALDLAASILTIAGGVIGTIAGEGNPYAAQAGSMLGSLAGRGIKAAYKANKRHHDGGWIERFHGGGWPGMGGDEQMAILQSGERVLSRREVSAMGGPAGVEAAARGGAPRLQVNVSAVDVRSVREFFENDGGRGFYNAFRTGRGMLPVMFGGRS